MARNRATRRSLAAAADFQIGFGGFTRAGSTPPPGFPSSRELQRARGLPGPGSFAGGPTPMTQPGWGGGSDPFISRSLWDRIRDEGLDALIGAGRQKLEEVLGTGQRDDVTSSNLVAQETKCEPGQIRLGGLCVDPPAILPGGDPFISRANGEFATTKGSFGIPAAVPQTSQRIRRKCPPGMVLGRDNLCYPRQVLGRRNRFRKWRAPARPPISRKDMRALEAIDRVQKTVKELAKKAGLKASKK